MSSSEPVDVHGWFRQRLASIAAEQPCRISGVACTVCTAPVDGYPRCVNCNRNCQSAHARLLADLVVPLAYAWEGRSQLGKDVYSYKRDSGQRAANSFVNLTALLSNFSTHHSECPGRRLKAAVTAVAVLPSLRGNVGTPLVRLSHLLPRAWPVVRLEPTGDYGNEGRQLDPTHFRIPDPGPARGGHVLILDDTWVTGRHGQSAAIAFKDAGAAHVTVLPICRLLEPGWPANETYRASQRRRAWQPHTCPVTGDRCP